MTGTGATAVLRETGFEYCGGRSRHRSVRVGALRRHLEVLVLVLVLLPVSASLCVEINNETPDNEHGGEEYCCVEDGAEVVSVAEGVGFGGWGGRGSRCGIWGAEDGSGKARSRKGHSD